MKYFKIAILSILGAACLYACTKNTTPGPGTGIVEFGETEVLVTEGSGLFSVPLVLTGEPGGYPVTVKIAAESSKDIDDVLLITSTTIRITEDNNSYVQMKTVRDNDDMSDYEVTLTIESVTGANVGSKSQCTIRIENFYAPRVGQYNFTATSGTPDTWTLIVREGANNTFILENLFGMEDSPKMIGVYNEDEHALYLDGRINGQGDRIWFGQGGWSEQLPSGEYLLIFGSGSGYNPIIFSVNENMELTSTQSSCQFIAYNPDTGAQRPLASFNGGTLEFAGENIEKPWPFN